VGSEARKRWRCRLQTAGPSGRREFYTRRSGDRAPLTSVNQGMASGDTDTDKQAPRVGENPVLIKPRNQFSAQEK
jgi:hypothetical protein